MAFYPNSSNSLFQQESYRQEPLASGRMAGVTDFIWATYRWMALALTVTGLTAWFVANTPSLAMAFLQNRFAFYGCMIAQVAMVIGFSTMVTRISTAAAAGLFLGYSVLNGLTLSMLFLVYTQASLAQAFFVSAASFGCLAVYGATTKRDLSPVGHFMGVGLIGFLIASVVNIFLQSPAIYWVSTYAGVLIFAGLTAYDNQNLKRMYAMSGGAGNLALRGALQLYLDFINMFLMMLRLFGDRR